MIFFSDGLYFLYRASVDYNFTKSINFLIAIFLLMTAFLQFPASALL